MNTTETLIHIDSLVHKKLFFDFWKLPWTTVNLPRANVSVINREDLSFSDVPNNSLVLLRGNSEPNLYRLENKVHFFGRIHKLDKYPENLQVISPVFDNHGEPASFILKDSTKKIIFLPFSLDEIFENFYYEKYILGKREIFRSNFFKNFYYFLKPFTPQFIQAQARSYLSKFQNGQKFPSWPLDSSFEDFKRLILQLLLLVSKNPRLPFIWFWPTDKHYCLTLTHDVERSLENNPGVFRMLSIEKKLSFCSSFNIVPFKYPINGQVIQNIKSHGCEVGIHGYSHDGKLFSSWKIFKKRIPKLNQIAKEWGATGFRSASTFRNPYWFALMKFDYDSSFFDNDPYEPQPGGCLSFFPYFIDNIVELPVTMPQDYTLFVLLKKKDIGIWTEKMAEIKKRNGMINLIAHPDEGYIGDEDKQKHYIEFLESLNGDNGLWNPLPKDLAIWWRKRHKAEIVLQDGKLAIKNGKSEMYIKWAKLTGRKLEFEE